MENGTYDESLKNFRNVRKIAHSRENNTSFHGQKIERTMLHIKNIIRNEIPHQQNVRYDMNHNPFTSFLRWIDRRVIDVCQI